MDRATCGTCLCPLTDVDEDSGTYDVVALPCGHVFHRSCVTLWLAGNSVCPSCRISCAARCRGCPSTGSCGGLPLLQALRPVILASMDGSAPRGVLPVTPMEIVITRKKDLEAKKHSADAEVADISDSIDQVKGKASELKRSAAQSETKVLETEARIARVNADIERLQKKADRNQADEVVQSFFKRRKEEDPQAAEEEFRQRVIGAAGSNFADELLNQMAAYRHAVERKYKDELDEVQRRRNEIRRRGSELRDLVETNRALEDRQLEAAVRSARRKRIRQLQGDAQILQDDSQMRVEYRTRTRQRVGGSAR